MKNQTSKPEKETIEMNLLVTLDSNYVGPLTVLLKSVMITNPETDFDIYVAHSSLTKEDFEKIKGATDPERTRIHPITVSAESLEKAPVLKRISKETYYRLLMMDYLPETVDRVLYLDPDIVVLSDLSTLYNVDFKGRMLAAASHVKYFIEDINKIRFKNPKDSRYFNAGVLVVNLEKMRKTVTSEIVFEYIEKNKRWLFLADQDVLNGMFGRDMICLDECIYNLDEKTMLYNRRRVRDLSWVEDNVIIVHYNGKYKPWKEGYKGKLAHFWFRFRDAELKVAEKAK